MRWLVLLGALTVACGGSVVSGSGGGGGAAGTGGNPSTGGAPSTGGSGGSPSTGGSGGSPSTGGSGGTPGTCTGFAGCCRQACTQLTSQLTCPQSPPTDCSQCSAPSGLPSGCEDAFVLLYRCMIEVGARSVTCDPNGQYRMRCGVCEAQQAGITQACGGATMPCSN